VQDLNLYKKEFEDQQKKVDRMKEEGCDEHDIKQQVREVESLIRKNGGNWGETLTAQVFSPR